MLPISLEHSERASERGFDAVLKQKKLAQQCTRSAIQPHGTCCSRELCYDGNLQSKTYHKANAIKRYPGFLAINPLDVAIGKDLKRKLNDDHSNKNQGRLTSIRCDTSWALTLKMSRSAGRHFIGSFPITDRQPSPGRARPDSTQRFCTAR